MSFKTIQAPSRGLEHGRADEDDGRDVEYHSYYHLLRLPLALVAVKVIQNGFRSQPFIKEHFLVGVEQVDVERLAYVSRFATKLRVEFSFRMNGVLAVP